MSTHRQLPPNTDIAPWQSRGRWYHMFVEQTNDGYVVSQENTDADILAMISDFTPQDKITLSSTDDKTFYLLNHYEDYKYGDVLPNELLGTCTVDVVASFTRDISYEISFSKLRYKRLTPQPAIVVSFNNESYTLVHNGEQYQSPFGSVFYTFDSTGLYMNTVTISDGGFNIERSSVQGYSVAITSFGEIIKYDSAFDSVDMWFFGYFE